VTTTLLDLNARRKRLKMPVAVLVRRAQVPRPTVFRILRGQADSVRFGHVQKVAAVLGVSFGTPPADPDDLRRRQAERKARLLRRLTQGTMGLEAQAVSDEVLNDLEREAVAKLLAGTGRTLWAD
jgi:transcriptional regulator with XRE-family HTH domain